MIPGGEPMRPQVFLSAWATLALGAATASAAGINLGWNDCVGGASYSLVETFACNTNAGIHTMVASFVAPAGITAMSGNEITIDMQTSGALLADWWTIGTGQCRPSTSLHGDFDFTGGPFTCYDYWQGAALGGLSWSVLPGWTNRCRIKGVYALTAGDPRITSIPEGTHVYSCKIVINNAKSTGSGACAGCGDEACIVMENMSLNQPPPLLTARLGTPATAYHVLWQGWSTPDPQQACPAVTPAKSRTWGSIKALYR
jgi:hypothetical protein